ncbi:PQQ-dependent sugar dehydrogenase [Siccirubricoccus sp. KC 17139]|uniref:PQQ-dependent sugar dehydrogenase n=1 Tax=Siccirubricoccus soli TaxID=2899147 RepID=A0ABT1DC11_9PROT|nr:PQQ-dependent sugar dehydrogenase [Siccirubricoccus soli]MCO6419472.1 PQQ-dependent sugar dehydrogenase [Siccirubricoccus soli]MCP2685607.1 PQQ-dependent sugar dehydrogenase [Siccirubricoccus soli]
MRVLALLLVSLLTLPATAQTRFRVEDFATGFEYPWGAAFLPDGRLLVTERPGRMRLVGRDGAVSAPLPGVPAVEARGQGGLLDVAVAPDFATTREVYLCHSIVVDGGALTRLVRARLRADGGALEGAAPILDVTPTQPSGRNHFGCRIVFGPDGAMYLSTGERQNQTRAQKGDDLAGKVLRLARNGAALADNPFARRPGWRPEIFTLGHRNPQGLAFNPRTGTLWEAEFGPRGGDEINVLRPGANYGWPVVTHGIDYDGSRIAEASSRPGMEDPAHVWVPSISPSGIAFYDGDAFPAWRGSLFVAGLNPPVLVRLSTQGDRVTGEERLLAGMVRFRQVRQGPDGLIYLLTDEARGRVLRLRPG